MNIPNIIADFSTILALKVGIGDTTATLESVTDLDGHTLANGVYSFTIDRKNSNKEYITCTLTGTSLTNIATVDRGTGVATAGFAKVHRKGAEVIISDFVSIKRLQDIFEIGYAGAYVPTTDYQLATKKYVDDLALGGTTTVDRVVVVGTCGEAVSTGELLYLKKSDSKWYLVDADDSATTDNVILGIAQGDGLINELITGGILITGVDTNQTGLTANSVYYASNTAGAISSTSGTNTRVIGFATDTDKLHFNPDFIKNNKSYAVDSVGTDSYAITLQESFNAYYAGMEISFKAGTANTGACSLNVNGLGAKTIKKDVSSDLDTNDIKANQIVKVIYDGTNFQLINRKESLFASGVVFNENIKWGFTNTIAHGLGVTPKIVKIIAQTYNCNAFSIFTNGNQYSSSGYAKYNDGIELSTTFRVTYDASSNDWLEGVITVDATNIIITWSETGAFSASFNVLWEAQA